MKTWVDQRGPDRRLTVISDESFYVDDGDKPDFTAAGCDASFVPLVTKAEPVTFYFSLVT